MKKRITAAALWVYAGWYAGAILSQMFGIHLLVGLFPGLVIAGLIAWNPPRNARPSLELRRVFSRRIRGVI